jgi:hypothetical protein
LQTAKADIDSARSASTRIGGRQPQPPFLTARNTGPAVMPAVSSHAFSAATGQAMLPRTSVTITLTHDDARGLLIKDGRFVAQYTVEKQ